MIHTAEIFPGITLYHFPDNRFKQSCLSLQLVRLAKKEEAAMNALLPAVLLRGCESAPDIRAITLRLDELYGTALTIRNYLHGDNHVVSYTAEMLEEDFLDLEFLVQ